METPVTPVLVPFSRLAPNVQTGDVILMHGEFAGSKLIEFGEKSIWSHSGMIVRSADIGLTGVPELLFWESNTLKNLPDVIFGVGKEGPMLVDLMQRLKTNATDYQEAMMTYVRIEMKREQAMFDAFNKFIPTVHNATFPSDFKMAWFEFLGRVLKRQSSLDQIFCSELVAGTMQAMGFMGTDWVWNAYEPGDFVKLGNVKLLNGGTVQKDVRFDPLS